MESPSERLKRLMNDPIEANMPSSYGLTQLERAELHMQQIEGIEEYVPCNKNPDFEIQAHEADWIYLILAEAPLFDQSSGERLSRPRLIKYRVEDFHKAVDRGFFNGQTLEILHKPAAADKYEEQLMKQRINQEEREERMKSIFDKNRLRSIESEMKVLKKNTSK